MVELNPVATFLVFFGFLKAESTTGDNSKGSLNAAGGVNRMSRSCRNVTRSFEKYLYSFISVQEVTSTTFGIESSHDRRSTVNHREGRVSHLLAPLDAQEPSV